MGSHLENDTNDVITVDGRVLLHSFADDKDPSALEFSTCFFNRDNSSTNPQANLDGV